MALAQTIIKNFMRSLDNTNLRGEKALDEAARNSSYFSSWQAVKNAMYNDLRSYGWNYKAFLKEKCGIDLSDLETGDTGAITGYDAGNGTVKTKESIVPENTKLDTRIGWGKSQHNGLTVYWPSNLEDLYNKYKKNKDTSHLGVLNISAYLYTHWITNGLNLIYDSYGLSFNEKGTTVKIMPVEYAYEDDNWRAEIRRSAPDKYGNTNSIKLRINRKYYPDVKSLDGQSTNQKESCYLDRVIAHELTHAVMAANIRYFGDLPHYFKEGAAELVHGADDDRYPEIRDLAQNPNKLYAVITNSSIKNPDNTNNGYAGGYMLLRYFAKQAAEQINSARTTTSLKVSSAGTYSLADKTTQSRYPNATTLDATGSTGTVILMGNSRNNVIKAGKGSSSLWGGAASSDVLQGGSGRDMFWFGKNDGNDVITEFHTGRASNSDVVNLYTGGLTSMSRSGKDVQFKMGSKSTLTVQTDGNADSVVQFSTDAKHIYGAKIGETNSANRLTYDANVKAFLGGSKQDTLAVSGSANHSVFLNNATGQAYAEVEIIDASASTGKDLLAGDKQANTIYGGSGGATMWGGQGSANDTMTGGSGRDMFLFGKDEGNDVITAFHAGRDSNSDVVDLYTGGLTDMTRSGKDVHFKMGKSTLTVQTDGTADSVVQFSTDMKRIYGIKIGEADSDNTLTYDANVKAFKGGNKQDNLAISGNASHSVFLNNATGQAYAGIEIIDASASTGKDLLAGDNQTNIIYGGSGETAMWGGPGSGNDTLVGGNGATTFLYGYGEGSDVIRNASSDDKVLLYNAALNKFKEASIYSDQVVLTTKLGQTLIVNGNAGTFTFADGSSWKPNYETKQWKRFS